MDKKKIIFTFGIILLLLFFLLVINMIIPKTVIILNGKNIINLPINTEYEEQGATAYLKTTFKKKKLDVEISGQVNSQKIGKYIITYRVKHNNRIREEIRIINVTDEEKPTLEVKQIKACQKNNLIEIDAKAFDNYDGDLTSSIKYKVNNDRIIISVQDSSQNLTIFEDKLNYIDEEKPEITLLGNNSIYLKVGEKYVEYGATAYDSCDGNITEKIKIESNVNVMSPGTYEVKYTIEDSLGNKTQKIRNVIVNSEEVKPVSDGIIYLTFDDGPGQYTNQILDILNSYNIKATFFVTNQFPKYQYLIKREYEEGHTVGIHTYSHKWAIYTSVETYLNDFYQIDDIVFSQTGIHPKYFRFPGGSSNTVSRNYKKGIMTELAQIMTEKGYTYFDWTFDSGDTSKNNKKDDILKNVKTYLKGDGSYIILLHDIKQNTLKALPEIIDYGLSRGYTFKSIDENTPVKHFKIAN